MDRRLQDPAHHLFRRLLLRDGAPTPIWSCRTRPISSAGTASRCSTGRSASADGPADAIRQPVVKPDRDVRPFQDVLIDLGARLKLPGLVNADGSAEISGRLSRLHRQSRAHARHRPARRLARRGRRRVRHGRGQPAPARALHRQRLLLAPRVAARASATSSTPTGTISIGRCRWAISRGRCPSRLRSFIREPLQQFPAGRPRARRRAAAGHAPRAHRRPISIRCRSGIRRSKAARSTPMPSRSTPSPSGRWPCTIPGARRTPGCGRSTASIVSICNSGRAPSARHSTTTTGSGSTSHHRPGQVPGRAHGGRQSGHGLDLERDRQARRRLEPRRRRAGSDARLPAQSSDRASCCRRATAATAIPTAIRSPARRPGTICASASRRRRRTKRTRPRRTSSRSSTAVLPKRAWRSDASAPSSAEAIAMTTLAADRRTRSSASSSISTPASAATPARRAARNGTPAATRRR